MAVVHKLRMPLTSWNRICVKVDEVNKLRDLNINIEDYKECSKPGKLLFDLVGVEIGAKENIELPEYYK